MTHVLLSMTKTFFILPRNRDFSKSRAVLPQELLGRIVAESLGKFRPNRGGLQAGLSFEVFFFKKKLLFVFFKNKNERLYRTDLIPYSGGWFLILPNLLK
jgi:hypothetical protein